MQASSREALTVLSRPLSCGPPWQKEIQSSQYRRLPTAGGSPSTEASPTSRKSSTSEASSAGGGTTPKASTAAPEGRSAKSAPVRIGIGNASNQGTEQDSSEGAYTSSDQHQYEAGTEK